MYDIGYVWFCGMFVARLEHVTCNMYITIRLLICFYSDVTTLLMMNFVCVIRSCFLFIISFNRDKDFLWFAYFLQRELR